MSKIKKKEYNEWLTKEKTKIADKYSLFWMLTGVRLYHASLREKYPAEFLPEEPKEDTEYYNNLTQ